MKNAQLRLMLPNLIAGFCLVILTPLPMQARRAKAHHTYEEFQRHRVLLERPDYDVEGALRALAGDRQIEILGFHIATAVCLANALALFVLSRRSRK